MAQGDKWQIGVGVPLINPRFTVPTRTSRVLNGAYAAATSTFAMQNDIAPARPPNLIAVGDYMTLGPSTDADNPGATETLKVKSVASINNITTESASVYDYASADPVSFIATNWPGGWKINSSQTGDNTVNSIVPGHRDQYGFSLTIDDDNVNAGVINIGTTHSTNKDSPLPDLLPNTTYRVEWWYKSGTISLGTSELRIVIRWYDQTPTAKFDDSVDLTTSTGWTERSFSVTPSATILSGTLSLGLEWTNTAVQTLATNLVLDGFVLHHAKGVTSGSSGGRITFPEDPDFGSLSIQSRRVPRFLDVGSRRYAGSSAADFGSIEKYDIVASFSNVDQAFWDDLKILLDYQRKGCPLVLWTYIDDLPHAMYGWLNPWPITKQHWDWGERVFRCMFSEA